MALVVLVIGSVTACNPAQRAKEVVKEIDTGNSAACVEERSTIEKAVEAFTLMNPDQPITELLLVNDGFIHQQSVLMDIGPNGTVINAPGTVCT